MSKTNETNGQRYDFFISYCFATGFEFAKHLKDYAKRNFQHNAFLDKEDIPRDIIEETDMWRSHIDRAIGNSKRFILIMTRGFNERHEIEREWKKASEKRINALLFKKDDLADEELIMKIDNKTFDFSKYPYTPFSDKYDLLAKVEGTLSGKLKPQETSSFGSKAEKLIAAEGLEIKQTNKPILEIVVGPSGNSEEWLPTIDHKNKELLSRLSPYCGNYCNMKARRNFFECESWNKEQPLSFFLKVDADGFFHLVEPLHNCEQYWLDAIFGQVLDMLLYCITVMKDKQLNTKQSVFICLRNVCGLDVRVADFQRIRYSFPNSAPEPFLAEFNPASSWREIGIVLKKIYRELCQEVSYEITEEKIDQRYEEMIEHSYCVRSLQAIKIDDFGFTDKNQKTE